MKEEAYLDFLVHLIEGLENLKAESEQEWREMRDDFASGRMMAYDEVFQTIENELFHYDIDREALIRRLGETA